LKRKRDQKIDDSFIFYAIKFKWTMLSFFKNLSFIQFS